MLVGYERYHIPAKEAPHAFETTSKFDISAKKLRLAAMLVHEAVHYRFNKDVVLSRPCIYGVFGGRLGGFKPIKRKCVGCMRCVQEYPQIMTVKYSEEYKRLGDSHWTPEAVLTIMYESSTGKIPVKGMGYKGSFGGEGWDGMWTDMSEIVRPTRDGVYGREYISTSIDIGRKPGYLDLSKTENLASRTVRSPLPIMFDCLPKESTNPAVTEAVRMAASRLGIYQITRSRAEEWNQVPVIGEKELDKLRETVGTARIVSVEDKDLDSYLRLSEKVRAFSHSPLVMAGVRLDDLAEDKVSRLVSQGVDIVHLEADYHGQDYSNAKRHVSNALHGVHTRLVRDGTRDQVTMVLSGGITLAEHVPKAIICGADLVSVDTTLLVALQSEFQGETSNREDCELKPRSLEPEWGAQRLVNLMASWHDQLIEILSAMGMRDVRRLRGDIGRSMTDEELREQAFEGIVKA